VLARHPPTIPPAPDPSPTAPPDHPQPILEQTGKYGDTEGRSPDPDNPPTRHDDGGRHDSGTDSNRSERSDRVSIPNKHSADVERDRTVTALESDSDEDSDLFERTGPAGVQLESQTIDPRKATGGASFKPGDSHGFMQAVRLLSATPVPVPAPSPFKFEMSAEAAEHNTAVLETFDNDLGKAIDGSPGTHISYGSEVRPPTQLCPLLGHHPSWQELQDDLLYGIAYPFETTITEEDRKAMLEENLARGNHKSAVKEEDRHHVTKLMNLDVDHGYAIPLTVEGVRKLKDAEVYPVGLQNQMTIDEDGNSIPKKRVTHDLSHNKASGNSVNQRVDSSDLPTAIYGHAMRRVLHLIHHIRRHNPGKRILCNKFDIDKAYRRLHTRASTAAKCIAVWFLDDMWKERSDENSVGLVMTRLPFGAGPAPPKFCIVSETVFDLGADLLSCELWEPTELPSPYASLLPAPTRLDESIPFGAAEEADVSLDEDCRGGVDGYIDDGITVVLDSEDNQAMVARAAQAVVMAIFLIFRPLAAGLEAIFRPDVASIRKMKAEGGLHELVTFLGWFIDTRRLLIALPREKWKAWTSDINSCLEPRRISCQQLKTLVGRLNQVCFIIPDALHFMNNIRSAMYRAVSSNSYVYLDKETKEDLRLWLEFLDEAKEGISINRLVFRKPTLHNFSDASEWGIGGHSPHTGIAWRYRFSEGQHLKFTLNCKEYIGLVVNSVIQSRFDTTDCPFPCYLDWSDSTSAVGWLRKSNFDTDEQPVHNAVARYHARHMMGLKACNYSQHMPGRDNIVTDCLSRDFHLSDAQLIAMLTSLNDSLSPDMLKIVQVPDDLISWISKLEQLAPDRLESPKAPTPSALAAGLSGWSSSSGSNTTMTPSWTDSAAPAAYASAVRPRWKHPRRNARDVLEKAAAR